MKKTLLFLTTLLLLGATRMNAQAPYAVLNNGTLTFYYDNSSASRTGTVYKNFVTTANTPRWYNDRSKVTSVVFNSSFANANITSCFAWFREMASLTSVSGTQYFKTTNVTNMAQMFYGCSSLKTLDISTWSTPKVTTFRNMFYNNTALTTLKISNLSTESATSTYGMFYYCTALTSLDVSKFKTSKVTEMDYMFQRCTSLTELNISSFTINSSATSQYMFSYCGLKKLSIPSTANNLDATACNMVGTASAPCTLCFPSGFTPQKTSTGSGWYQWKKGYFKDGPNITPGGGDTPTTKGYAVLSGTTLTFYYDNKSGSRSGTVYDLNTGANAPGWNSKASTVTKVVFDESFENARPTSCYRWFYGMTKITTVDDLWYLNPEKVTNMASMFQNCSSLKDNDYIFGWDTSNVTTFANMFYGCTSLTYTGLYDEDVETIYYPDSHVIAKEIPKYHCEWNTSKATDFSNMFYNCSSLTELALPSFTIGSSANTSNMFYGCKKLSLLHLGTNFKSVNANAFTGVGTTTSPCLLTGFYVDNATRYPNYFTWKGGNFKDPREAYAIIRGNELQFYYDEERYKTEIVLDLYDGDVATFSLNGTSSTPEWNYYTKAVEIVEFEESFKDARPVSCYQWFNNMSNLATLVNLKNLNTSGTTSFGAMFYGCKKLKSIDVSNFTFASTASTSSMFAQCSALKTLTIPSSAANLNNNACSGVGTASSPCTLVFPSSFTPQKTSTGNGYYVWKSGYFTDSSVEEDEPKEYAVLSGSILTFYYDDKYNSRSGTVYNLNTDADKPGWNAKASSVKKVVFDSSFEDAYPSSTYYWFGQMSNLTSVEGMEYLYTEGVTNMAYMFYGCSQLTGIDVSTFDTSNVSTMAYMFSGCSKLSSLWLATPEPGLEFAVYGSTFTTAAATNLSNMFAGCSSLKNLVLVEFTIKSGANTSDMLKGCTALESLYINTNMNALNASALSGVGTATSPCLLEFHNWDAMPQASTIMPTYYIWKGGYFYNLQTGYAELSSDGKTLTFKYDIYDDMSWTGSPLDLYHLNSGSTKPGWSSKVANVTKVVFEERFKYVRPASTYAWMSGMSNLTTVTGLQYLNTERVTNLSTMFNGCKKLTSLDLSNITIPSGANSKQMLYGCSGLKTLTIGSSFKNLSSDGCSGVGTTSAPCQLNYPSGFEPEKTSTGNGWYQWKGGYFKGESVTPPASGIAYAVLNGGTLTFYYDNSSASRTGTVYKNFVTTENAPRWYNDRSKVTSVVFNSSFVNANITWCFQWFRDMTSLTSVSGTQYFNTSNVTNMAQMFYGCSSLKTLDISTWSTPKVTTFRNMFYSNTSLTTLKIGNLSTESATSTYGMFYYCTALTSLNVSKFKTSKVTEMDYMFQRCTSLTELDISSFTINSSATSEYMFSYCGLKKLSIPSTANNLHSTACNMVGSASAPCTLCFPSGFKPDKTKTTSTYYVWKTGYFKDGPNISAVLKGDANMDGEVNVTDIMTIVNYLLNKPVPVFSEKNANWNEDSDVNVTDIMLLVNYLLYKPVSVMTNARTATLDAIRTQTANGQAIIHLDNHEPYTALEMTLTVPEGCAIGNARVCKARSNGHQVVYNRLDDTHYRVLVYTMTGQPLASGSTALLRFNVSGLHTDEIEVSDVLSVTTDYETVAITDCHGAATGIQMLDLDAESGPIYNTQGMKVRTPGRGVYIQNGRKVVVK